jgi:anti-sigma factor RsiW
MTTALSQRDIESLSLYLDGQLSANEAARLESRLLVEGELRTVLEEMRRTRAVLRAAPILRAPRNYTLKSDMVKVRQPPPRAYPILRLASALASLLFVLAFVGDLIGYGSPAQAPVVVVQQVELPEAAPMEESAPTEQMLMQSKVAPAPAAELALEPLLGEAATETPGVAEAQTEILMASPTSTPTSVPIGASAGDVMRQATDAQPEQPAEQTGAEEQTAIKIVTSPSWWTSLRIFEAIVLMIALATGLAAFFVRRTGSGL